MYTLQHSANPLYLFLFQNKILWNIAMQDWQFTDFLSFFSFLIIQVRNSLTAGFPPIGVPGAYSVELVRHTKKIKHNFHSLIWLTLIIDEMWLQHKSSSLMILLCVLKFYPHGFLGGAAGTNQAQVSTDTVFKNFLTLKLKKRQTQKKTTVKTWNNCLPVTQENHKRFLFFSVDSRFHQVLHSSATRETEFGSCKYSKTIFGAIKPKLM